MREKPGVIMGYLAYGHPFLDGNGRTIIVVHGVMAQRAAISIDWAATDKAGYLDDRFHESCHKRGIHLGFRTPI
jgi:cell filamentation protein